MKKAALLGLILVVAVWAVGQAGKPSIGRQAMPAWAAPQLADATGIEIAGGHLEVKLSRSGKQPWQVETADGIAAANGDAVRQLLADLGSMRPVRVVAHDSAHDAELHLDAAHAVRVRVTNGDTSLLELSVGGQGSDLVSTYVRRAGEPEAVAVNRALLWQLKRPPTGWKAPKPDRPSTDKQGVQQPTADAPAPAKAAK